MLPRLILALLLAGPAWLAGPWATARAQEAFPSRPIRIIVPFAAGGPSDIIARLLAPRMSQELGQPVVVEPRPGAGGVTGVDVGAKAAPDGHTIIIGSAGGLAISPGLDRPMPYDVNRDLAPLTLAVIVPEPVLVPASQPWRNLAELLAAARAAPGRLNYASAGPGSMPHLAAELIKLAAGVDITHIPYRGGGPIVLALLGGEVQMGLADLPIALPQIRAGAIRALAIGHGTRVPWLPEVPTMAEAGLPDVSTDNWHGFVAPARVPPAILARLHAAIIVALREPATAQALYDQGALPGGNSPEEFGAFIRAEQQRWAMVIRRAGVTAE